MSEDETLKIRRGIVEALQRKLDCLAERAFVQVDSDGTHNISEEHKPLYDIKDSEPKRPIVE